MNNYQRTQEQDGPSATTAALMAVASTVLTAVAAAAFAVACAMGSWL